MSSSRRWPWEAQGVPSAHQENRAQKAHRSNRWLTIFLPMAAGVVLVGALAAWLIAGAGTATVAHASALVIIFMSLGCMISGLLVLVALLALILGMHRVYGNVPLASRCLLESLCTAQRVLTDVGDKTAEPVLRWNAMRAAAKALWRKIGFGGRP